MAITLSAAFLANLKSGNNTPVTILEVVLDSGTVKWGTHREFTDVRVCVKSVSSLQNKLDTKAGYSTRGQLTVTIVGRDNFTSLVSGDYLKNRRVTRKDGFAGMVYADYAATYTGTIQDWSRKGDELTLIIQDDLVDASKKLPVENATKTQSLDYRNTNPVDIMTNLLITQLGISSGLVNSTQFESERDLWLNGWKFDRVLTEPKAADEYLNELQIETNSYVIHDGEKISYKVFAPPTPGQTIEEWTDTNHILHDTFSLKSGYKDGFYNRVVFYYDYDESGSDKEDNFEAAVIAVDSASQDSGQWDESSTKVIKSKWVRSHTYSSPSNVTGVVIYHASRNNSTGSGTLTYDYSDQTLQWTPPGGTIGEAVKVTKDGKYQLFGADKTKWIRVIVTTASLAGSDKTDTITLTTLSGENHATTMAQKILSRYRDPVPSVSMEIDVNSVSYNSTFIKPTDLKDMTTAEACEKGSSTWNTERCLLTSIRPDFAKGTMAVEAIPTRMYRRYGFICPASYPDYGSATAAQKERAFVGAATTNLVGSDAGYYSW